MGSYRVSGQGAGPHEQPPHDFDSTGIAHVECLSCGQSARRAYFCRRPATSDCRMLPPDWAAADAAVVRPCSTPLSAPVAVLARFASAHVATRRCPVIHTAVHCGGHMVARPGGARLAKPKHNDRRGAIASWRMNQQDVLCFSCW